MDATTKRDKALDRLPREDERDTILRIVADWAERLESGGADTDDLIWELKQVGYTLPKPTTKES